MSNRDTDIGRDLHDDQATETNEPFNAAPEPDNETAIIRSFTTDLRNIPAIMSDKEPGAALTLGANDVEQSDIRSVSISTAQTDESGILDPLRTFTLFKKLPPELRNRIWTFAAHLRRNVDIWASEDDSYCVDEDEYPFYIPYKYVTATRPPAILHTSQEARSIGLRYYKLEFGVNDIIHDQVPARTFTSPARIYMNYASDRIFPMGSFCEEATDALMRCRAAPKSFVLNLNDRDSYYGGAMKRVFDHYEIDDNDVVETGPLTWPAEIYLYKSEKALDAKIDTFRTIDIIEAKQEPRIPVDILPMVEDPMRLIRGLALMDRPRLHMDKPLSVDWLADMFSLAGWMVRTNASEICRMKGEETPKKYQGYLDTECPRPKLASLVLDGKVLDTFDSKDFMTIAKADERWKKQTQGISGDRTRT